MPSDPFKSDLNVAQVNAGQTAEPRPDDADIVRTLVEIEQATQRSSPADLASEKDQPQNLANAPVLPESSGLAKRQLLRVLLVSGAAILIAFNVARLSNVNRSSRASGRSTRAARSVDARAQNEIEGLLARVAAGDRAAATDMLERAPSFTGKTQRTESTNRSINIAFNSSDLHEREASIEANLALDGVPKTESEIETLKAQLSSPVGRPWALWSLGALGHRGVDPMHTAKIIGAYLDAPDANTRAAAVNALAVLATDETVPMLLDRFRNDPSPVVQERAACSLAESGMYTHEQRVVAAATLVSWLDDSLLSPQQHAWTIQALGDIAHQNFGNDSAAWRSWLEGARDSG